MTTRQAHEISRIQHRFGRTDVHPMHDNLIALEVVGDAPVEERPSFRLVLGADGWVLRREELILDPLAAAAKAEGRKHGSDYLLDGRVLALLTELPEAWLTSRRIAEQLDDPDVARIARSLRRLSTSDLVESRGLSRDKKWRVKR